MKFWQFSFKIMPSSLTVPVLLCLLSLITNGEAIKCFVCDSSDNPSCANLRSNSSIVAEECTLNKIRSLKTWLFELNQFAYFDNGSKKDPLMNCQKVVARDPNTNELVTARFCQLNSGESDSCEILKHKLLPKLEDQYNKRNNRKNGRKDGGGKGDEEENEEFHCSVCTKDGCNGSERLRLTVSSSSSIGALLVVAMTLIMQRIRW